MNIQTMTIADLLSAGIAVTLDPMACKREAIIESKPVEESTTETIVQVKTPAGCILRTYNMTHLTKDQKKVAQAIKICAEDGWHLWEMKFALYCAEHGLNPAYTSAPVGVHGYTYDPMRFKSSFVRSAFINYAKTLSASSIAKLKAI